MRERIKIFTWHIYGSYLFYLSQGDFDIYIPLNKARGEGYVGRGTTFPFGDNVHEVAAEEVKNISFDCIIFQTPKNYFFDQFEILSQSQQLLPRFYLEHDPPQGALTDTLHVVNDPEITVVHVTHFNNLMWHCHGPTAVIDHGITTPTVNYTGELERGIVVLNNLPEHRRRLGIDIFLKVRERIPLDLIGMGSENLGGLGEILHPQLPAFISRYRFFFNPIRYTSLDLAVLEAMSIGIPVVGLATTEIVTVIQNGVSGIIHTDVDELIVKMEQLIFDKGMATQIGREGKKIVLDRFSIARFTNNWHRLLEGVVAEKRLLEMVPCT